MNEPTQEQIKEFWEWCEFSLVNPQSQISYYWTPDGKTNRELPPIDLNNLFKYAVPLISDQDKPEVHFITHWRSKNELTCRLWRHSKANVTQVVEGSVEFESKPTEKDYALALFWALEEAMK